MNNLEDLHIEKELLPLFDTRSLSQMIKKTIDQTTMTTKEFRKKNREKRRVFSTPVLVVMGLMAAVFALMSFGIYITDFIPFKIHPFFEILCYSLLLLILFFIFDKGYRKTILGFFKK